MLCQTDTKKQKPCLPDKRRTKEIICVIKYVFSDIYKNKKKWLANIFVVNNYVSTQLNGHSLKPLKIRIGRDKSNTYYRI